MRQLTFASVSFDKHRKQTRRAVPGRDGPDSAMA